MKSKSTSRWMHVILCGMGLVAALSTTGCQVSLNGQTLPSPYYMQDDVQYFPPSTEFPLSKEAAMMQQAKAQQMSTRQQP